MNEDKKLIPLSVIDAKIKEFQIKFPDNVYDTAYILKLLEEIKKESISIQTQPSIPMSVIDALISEFQSKPNHWIKIGTLLAVLKKIKKEAIPSPIEQKIKDRIKELEDWNPFISDDRKDYALEELRKLLK